MSEWYYKPLVPGGYIAYWSHPDRGWAIIASGRKYCRYALVVEHTDGNFLEIAVNEPVPVEGEKQWLVKDVLRIIIP